MLAAVLLAGCVAPEGRKAPPPEPAAQAPATGVVQRVPFRIGVSSHTVQQLARAQACTSAQGAGLVTEPGPVEVYRIQCDNGQVFLARCELRECRRM